MSTKTVHNFIVISLIFSAVLLLPVEFVSAQALPNSQRNDIPVERQTGVNSVVPPQETKQTVLQRVQEKRQSILEENTARREELKEKIEGIQDEKKKNAVEKIDNALLTINTNKTQQWATALTSLRLILDDLNTKIVALETDGIDTTEAKSLISTADTALTTAATQLETQAANTYIVEITDESTLGQSVRPVVQQFKDDLKNTLTVVKSARDAVREAARALTTLSTRANTPNPADQLDMEPPVNNGL